MAGELRITGGRLVRRRIQVPPAADRGQVRPTSDKVRAALFSSLGDAVAGARVLDLFAGSGALGIEALSRGAQSVLFVERHRATARVVQENLRALDLAGTATVRTDEAARVLKGLPEQSLEICFVDPPYAMDLTSLWPDLVRVLTRSGLLVLERDRRSRDPLPLGLSPHFDRVYGDTRVVILQRVLGDDALSTPKDEEATPVTTAAIYPGSFDPLTNGHVDIVIRGLKMFDRVILAIANNPQKSPLFSVTERLDLCRQCLGHLKGIEVDAFDGLVVDYAQKRKVGVLLRGLRAVSDFEYEFQLASMNRKLAPAVDTVFMMTSEESFYLSSRLVREVATFGGNVRGMVPDPVFDALAAKLGPASKMK